MPYTSIITLRNTYKGHPEALYSESIDFIDHVSSLPCFFYVEIAPLLCSKFSLGGPQRMTWFVTSFEGFGRGRGWSLGGGKVPWQWTLLAFRWDGWKELLRSLRTQRDLWGSCGLLFFFFFLPTLGFRDSSSPSSKSINLLDWKAA